MLATTTHARERADSKFDLKDEPPVTPRPRLSALTTDVMHQVSLGRITSVIVALAVAVVAMVGGSFVLTAEPAAAAQVCAGGQYTIGQLEADPYSDWDQDQIPNYGEYLNGTSPCAHPCAYLTNADISANPFGDWDGDGWSNRYESQQGMPPCQYTTVVPAVRQPVVAPTAPPAPRATTAPRPRATTPPAPRATTPPRPTSTPAPTLTPIPTPTTETVVIDLAALRDNPSSPTDLGPTVVATAQPTPTLVPASATSAPTAAPTPVESFDFDDWAASSDAADDAGTGQATDPDGDRDGADVGDADDETAGGFVLDVETGCSGLDFDGQCLAWTHLAAVLIGAGAILGGVWYGEYRRRIRNQPSLKLF